MRLTLDRTRAVGVRVVRQLRSDHRLVAISLVVPMVVIFLLKVFFNALQTPLIDQSAFAVPGGAFIVHFLTYVLTAIVLVRERAAGTLERMFINGYRQIEIITGYLAAYTVLATLQSLIVLGELTLLFDLSLGLGRLAEVYVVIWLLAVVSMALGIFVSNFARNEGQVIPFIPLMIVPTVFLSGLVVSIDKLPEWAQVLSRITPLYYAIEVIDGIDAGGHLLDTWLPLVILPVLAAALLLLATQTLREEL